MSHEGQTQRHEMSRLTVLRLCDTLQPRWTPELCQGPCWLVIVASRKSHPGFRDVSAESLKLFDHLSSRAGCIGFQDRVLLNEASSQTKSR